jgi:hypothetical protein
VKNSETIRRKKKEVGQKSSRINKKKKTEAFFYKSLLSNIHAMPICILYIHSQSISSKQSLPINQGRTTNRSFPFILSDYQHYTR